MPEQSAPIASLDPNGGAMRIARERLRQIEGENWTPEHDDKHWNAELAWAAVCYAAPGPVYIKEEHAASIGFIDPWPWDGRWDKRGASTRIRDLEKAGALIAAEIDRLLRLIEANPL